jgi:hypothetical protein
VTRGLNEVLFPVGCSLVLFATEVWAKQWKSASEHALEPKDGLVPVEESRSRAARAGA